MGVFTLENKLFLAYKHKQYETAVKVYGAASSLLYGGLWFVVDSAQFRNSENSATTK